MRASLAITTLLSSGVVVAACGGDTDLSGCILPDPADRLPLRQETYIKAPAAASNESSFGGAVVLSGDGSTLVVGAPTDPSGALGSGADPTDRSKPNAGAAYVFARSGTTWVQQAYLKPSSKYAASRFGWVLAISKTGDTVAVGVPEDSTPNTGLTSGATVVFKRVGTTWSEDAYLHASPSMTGASFGTSVALSDDGETAVVSAPYVAGEGSPPCRGATRSLTPTPRCPGAAFVFRRTNGRWEERSILVPPTSLTQASNAATHMGRRVAISGDGSVVACLSAGALLTFRQERLWAFEAIAEVVAVGPDGASPPLSLALSGDGRTLAIGGPDSERVDVFTRRDGGLRKDAVLQSLASRSIGQFGWSVALSTTGTRLAVGAWLDASGVGGTNPNPCGGAEVAGAGSAYVFTSDGIGWKERAFVKAPFVHENAGFGNSIALDAAGATLAVGSPGDPSSATGIGGDEGDGSSPSAGAVHVFR